MEFDDLSEDRKKEVNTKREEDLIHMHAYMQPVIVAYARPVQAHEVEYYMQARPADVRHEPELAPHSVARFTLSDLEDEIEAMMYEYNNEQ